MRAGFIILIIGFNVASYGQSLSELHKRLKLLATGTDFQYDTTGFSALPKFNYFCANDNKNSVDYYHVTDLNQDGLNDLIYSGPCKPYAQTGLFVNTGRAYKKIFSYPGKLISVDSQTSGTVIHILKEACCCDSYSEYIELKVNQASKVTKNIIAFGAKTKIELGSGPAKEKVVGIIRTTPVIDDFNKKDSCRNQVIKGNHITRINKFSDIAILNKVGLWWLVLYPQNKERSVIGWMKMSN